MRKQAFQAWKEGEKTTMAASAKTEQCQWIGLSEGEKQRLGNQSKTERGTMRFPAPPAPVSEQGKGGCSKLPLRSLIWAEAHFLPLALEDLSALPTHSLPHQPQLCGQGNKHIPKKIVEIGVSLCYSGWSRTPGLKESSHPGLPKC